MESTTQLLMDKVPESIWTPVTNWGFVSCCLVIAGFVLTAKRVMYQGWPAVYASGKAKAVFTSLYFVLGMLAAIPKSYLTGIGYFQRAVVGVIAGFLSLLVYHALLKKLASFLGVKESDITDPDDDKGLHALSGSSSAPEAKP